MIHIVVASNNPVKLAAVTNGFTSVYSDDIILHPVSVPSNVSDQPMSDCETLEGAKNRAQNARREFTDADFWVGIEGGVEFLDGKLAAFAWVVILNGNVLGSARTGAFFLPLQVSALVANGMELGEADDLVFGQINSKQQNGAIGILTNDLIDRESLYRPAVIMALIPFLNPTLDFG